MSKERKRTMTEVISERPYKHKYTPSRASGSKVLTLKCGHTVSRKASIPTPERAHCPICHDVRMQLEAIAPAKRGGWANPL